MPIPNKKICKAVIYILAAVFLLITSCDTGSRYPDKSTTSNLSTPTGMINYLKNLPAVKDVQVWQNIYGPGVTITTKHYTVHTTLLEPLMLRQVPGFMESAHKAYQSQLPKPIETKTMFTVYLFGDRAQWEEFTKEFTGPAARLYLKIQKGAYYLNDACVAYNIGRTRTFSVLAHEGWHHFNSKHFTYRMPSWLDEGIATLFEASRYEKGLFYFDPQQNGGRLGSLRKTLQTDNIIPLRTLIGLNPGEVVSDTDDVMAFYAQSYALVRFLREENYGIRLRNYHDLLLGALRGSWPLEASLKKIAANRNIPLTTRWNKFVSPKLFSLYIEEDLEKLEAGYLAFCRKIVYRVRLANEK